MKRALIDYQNNIVQIEPVGGEFEVSPDFHWRDCPDECIAYHWIWDGVTFSPPPGPSLAEVKSAKLAQIERDRDTQRYANVSAHGRNWQADQTSQDLLNGAINLAGHGVPLPAVWRDADNADMPVTTLADLVVIAGAMAAATQTAYATSWARKAAVEAATTVEEVGGI